MSFKITKVEPKGNVSITKLAYKVEYVEGSYSVSSTDLSATTSHTALTADTSYVQATFDSYYTLMTASGITLGYYLLRHEAFDVLVSTDNATFTFSKSLFDEAGFVDEAVKIFHGKGNFDTVVVEELLDVGLQKHADPDFGAVDDSISYTVQFRRNFLEDTSIVDVITFDTSKVLGDTTVGSESLSKGTTTTKTDAFDADESISVGAGKVFSNAYTVTDYDTLSIGKVNNDAGSLDFIIRFDVARVLSDTINATDDFLGESNIDDDQTMHFGKTLVDNFSTSDVLSRDVAYARLFTDSSAGSDNTTLNPNLFKADAITTSDSFNSTVQYSREFTDSGSLDTAIYKAVGTKAQDNGTVLDSDVKSFGSNNSDSASVTDSGALFWQDYVEDPSYFGGDYVGNRQLF